MQLACFSGLREVRQHLAVGIEQHLVVWGVGGVAEVGFVFQIGPAVRDAVAGITDTFVSSPVRRWL